MEERQTDCGHFWAKKVLALFSKNNCSFWVLKNRLLASSLCRYRHKKKTAQKVCLNGGLSWSTDRGKNEAYWISMRSGFDVWCSKRCEKSSEHTRIRERQFGRLKRFSRKLSRGEFGTNAITLKIIIQIKSCCNQTFFFWVERMNRCLPVWPRMRFCESIAAFGGSGESLSGSACLCQSGDCEREKQRERPPRIVWKALLEIRSSAFVHEKFRFRMATATADEHQQKRLQSMRRVARWARKLLCTHDRQHLIRGSRFCGYSIMVSAFW